jgi:hypothetical protein
LSLRSRVNSSDQNSTPEPEIYTLRLLESSNCPNATSISLADSLKHFPSLVYLDLSRTWSARDPSVIFALRQLPLLQILKLRGLGLQDEHIQVLGKSIGHRVRSLDLRDNRLTDDAVRLLLQECITTTSRAKGITRSRMIRSQGIPLVMQEFFGFDLPSVYRTHGQDEYMKKRLTSGFEHYLGIEDASGTGLTHLYISGNHISVYAVAHLLRIQRLHVLDVGTTSFTETLPGRSEDLVPLLEKNAQELTYLRLNHSVVTQFTSEASENLIELDAGPIETASAALPQDDGIQELEGDSLPIQELPADSVFELEGSSVPENITPEQTPEQTPSPVLDGLLNPINLQRPLALRRDSEIAPEPVEISPPLISPLVSPFSPTHNFHPFQPLYPPTPVITVSADPEQNRPEPNPISQQREGRPRTYSGLLADHDARVKYQKSQPHGLLPSMMPALRSLSLTDIPLKYPTPNVSQHIIAFIKRCAEESHWSRLQSKVSYALPPGETGQSAELTYAKSLFALRRLVLEMRPYRPNETPKSSPRSPRRAGKSAVEDADCELFWTAAQDDFSFFNNEEEECGLPGSEMRNGIPLEVQFGKMLVGDDSSVQSPGRPRSWTIRPDRPIGSEKLIDTLAEISKFRTEKKVLYQAALQRGEVEPFVDGYWEGQIIVIRNS